MGSSRPEPVGGEAEERAKLADVVARVREQGFALDDEENEPGVRCLAVPVRDAKGAVVGAVNVSTITFLETREALVACADTARSTAQALHGLLG